MDKIKKLCLRNLLAALYDIGFSESGEIQFPEVLILNTIVITSIVDFEKSILLITQNGEAHNILELSIWELKSITDFIREKIN